MHPKFVELHDRLNNFDIDVLAVQEPKLQKTGKTPFIKGYATVLKDWNKILWGGLLFVIPTDIVFEKLLSLEKAGMEILSIRLKTTKPTWLELYNVYLPNTSSQWNSFDLSQTKPGPSLFLVTSMATLKCRIHFNPKTNVWQNYQLDPRQRWLCYSN